MKQIYKEEDEALEMQRKANANLLRGVEFQLKRIEELNKLNYEKGDYFRFE